MEASGLTPTKSFCRVSLTPNSKSSFCLQCGKNIESADKRRKLFDGENKTQCCKNFDRIVGISQEKSTITYFTNTICRGCSEKNVSLLRKADLACNGIQETQELLKLERGEIVQKRGRSENVSRETSSKRRVSLFVNTEEPASNPKVKDQWTQTDEQETNPSSVSVIINYPNTKKKITLPSHYHQVGRQLALGNPKSIAASLAKVKEVQAELLENLCNVITNELKGLCSTNHPSVLRQSSKEDLINFSWDKVHEELKKRTPTLERFARACVGNPSQTRNVHKKNEALIPGMCDSVCQLISIFSEGMNTTRTVKSIILKKCGLTKIGFQRMALINVCMGYNATNSLFERFGEDFDKKLLKWKQQVEDDVKEEKKILASIKQLENENASAPELNIEHEKLISHREIMHPGYSFTGDNVDLKVRPRQMTQKNQNKDHHMFQYVAYENRVSPNHLADDVPVGDISKVPFTTFLPNADEQQLVAQEIAVLVCQIWAAHIPSLGWFKDCAPKVITHKHMQDMKKKTNKVHLGVLRKNEQYEEDMIDLLEWIHPYVPGHDEDNAEAAPVKILNGGDYLTYERHKGAQSSMQDSRTPSSQLRGLMPKFEDFHTQCEWLKVIWYHLYDTSSARDIGTLYQARNAINARNVTKDPHSNYYAASEFLNKVLKAYVVAGGLKHFGMSSIEDEPTENVFCGNPLDKEAKREYVLDMAKKVIDEHVMHKLPEFDAGAPTSNELKCQFCGKMYKRPTYLRKHEEKKHGHLSQPLEAKSTSKTKEDMLHNYTRNLLVLLLLRENHNDAIKRGDVGRVIRLYKFFTLYFKVSNCPKYAYASLELQAQLNCLLTPRMAYSLTWNRFVNHKGQADTNHPMDLDLEHDNKYFKNDIHSYRGEITDKSIARVGRSVEGTQAVLRSFDKSSSVKIPSGNHTQLSTEEDLLTLVEHLQQADVFSVIPERHHSAFPNMPHSLLDAIDMQENKAWISKSLKTFGTKHYYKLE